MNWDWINEDFLMEWKCYHKISQTSVDLSLALLVELKRGLCIRHVVSQNGGLHLGGHVMHPSLQLHHISLEFVECVRRRQSLN